MKKTKLKPFVHKVKGAKNYALYDLLKGSFYTLSPDKDIEDIKESLKEAGLTFETEGTVPVKILVDMKNEKETIKIRELQVRINGREENNCWMRERRGRKRRSITKKILEILKKELTDIPVHEIRIEAEIPDREKTGFILEELPYETVSIFVQKDLTATEIKYFSKLCEARNKTLKILTDGKKNIKELKVEVYNFFYSQHFNPCLGQQVAVDCCGEIKPCLWWEEKLGILGVDNLKNMIIKEMFDKYWRLTKDKVNVCKDCEFRYACPDCRLTKTASLTEKPCFCDYNPFEI